MHILNPGSGIAIAIAATAVCALAVSSQGQAPSPRYLYVNGQAGSRDTQVVNVIDTTAGEVVTGLATGVGLAESLRGLARALGPDARRRRPAESLALQPVPGLVGLRQRTGMRPVYGMQCRALRVSREPAPRRRHAVPEGGDVWRVPEPGGRTMTTRAHSGRDLSTVQSRCAARASELLAAWALIATWPGGDLAAQPGAAPGLHLISGKAGATVPAAAASRGLALTPNGRFILFESDAPDLVSGHGGLDDHHIHQPGASDCRACDVVAGAHGGDVDGGAQLRRVDQHGAHVGGGRREVGGVRGTETYLLIANRGRDDRARVTLYYEDGSRDEKEFVLPASSRTNVAIAAEFASAHGRRFGAVVEALGDDPHIAVERAMYSSLPTQFWAAGSARAARRSATVVVRRVVPSASGSGITGPAGW